MERYQIAAELRDGTGKGVARKLRAAGRIPAIAYGKHVEKPINLSVGSPELVTILNQPTGRYMPLDIMVGDEKYAAVIRDIQVHALTRKVRHIDFLLLKEDAPVRVKVPVRTVGRSLGEAAGARLVIARREVLLSALPAAIPSELVVDVTLMETGDVLYIDQMELPEGCTASYRTRYPVIVLKTARIIVEEEVVVEGEEGEEGEESAEGEEGAEGKEGKEGAPEASK
jgi:large subunit ribosomal protein L25